MKQFSIPLKIKVIQNIFKIKKKIIKLKFLKKKKKKKKKKKIK